MAARTFANPIGSYISGYAIADEMIARNKELRSRLRSEELNRAINQQTYDLNERLNPLKIAEQERLDMLSRYTVGDTTALPSNSIAAKNINSDLSVKEANLLKQRIDNANSLLPYGIVDPLVQLFRDNGYNNVKVFAGGLQYTDAYGNTVNAPWADIYRNNPNILNAAVALASVGQRSGRQNSGLGYGTTATNLGIGNVAPTVLSNMGIGGAPAPTMAPATAPATATRTTSSGGGGGGSGRLVPSVPNLTRYDPFLKRNVPISEIFYNQSTQQQNIAPDNTTLPLYLNEGSTNQTPTSPDVMDGFTPEMLQRAIEQVESSGDVNAISPKGAIGPMQVMPETAVKPGYQEYGMEDIFSIADRLGISYPDRSTSSAIALNMNPEVNREYGFRYFLALLNRFGNLDAALAAYNMGPGALQRHLNANNDQLVLEKLPAETRNYIPKVRAELARFMQQSQQDAMTAYR